MTRVLAGFKIPEYRPSEKVSFSISMVFNSYLSVKTSFILLIFVDLSPQSIETDETAKKPDLVKMPISSEEEREAISQLEEAIATDNVTAGKSQKICNWTSR